ncbi:hypothetical protein GCM10011340_30670 [Roseivirga thermotolerans]|uniref:Lipoprotein n=1 Tax=Roseivirga thermotolerans TaxID=1758176 RepID=A0ABQ3IC76_9BACT|nr:hypothetical protein GCM10011340_30670 [Roseivirga thermotolerans]
MYMHKTYSLLIVIFCMSCSPHLRGKITTYSSLSYKFSDSGNRSLKIDFKNDSIVTVSNRTSIAHNHGFLNFDVSYEYKTGLLGTVIIVGMLNSNRIFQENDKYLKPYENRDFSFDSGSADYLFPDISGDTIRFSRDFNTLQIKEFSFKRSKR